jgi:hypothetical protein
MIFIYSILLLIFFSVSAYAQHTITSPPVIGDSYVIRYCDTNNVNQGSGGANQTWNYSSIIQSNDSALIDWVSPNGTPYAANYPNSDRVQRQDDNYLYYDVQNGELIYYGFSNSAVTEILSDPYPHIKFPFTYNNSYSDNFAGTITATALTFIRTGSINVNADGWGTINLPAGSFSNALRVHTILDITDSIGGGFPIVVRTLTHTYQWYVPGKKFPVFAVIIVSNTTLAGTTTTKQVYYSPNQTVGINVLSTSVPEKFELSQNYPNPFNPETKIKFSLPENAEVRLKIFDITGREAASLVNERLSAGTYEADWRAEGFNSGVYFYTLTANGNTITRKMLLVK